MTAAAKKRPAKTGSKIGVEPLDDRVLVRPDDPEQTTASGLVIPETARDRPLHGTVLAVGPGRRCDNTGDRIALDIAVGSTVVFAKFGGTELTIDGDDLLILNSKDVLATLAKKGTK
jgi:chaperonin GroES